MHADQLETGQLHHCHGIRRHISQLGQQCGTDIAAQENLAAGGLEHFGNQGGGGGLAIGAGHSHNLAGAELKEQLHLTGDHRAGLLGRLQRCLEVLIAGGAHDDILPRKPIGIVFAQAQVDIQPAQCVGIIAEGFQRFFLVTEGHIGPHGHKLLNALFVADAGPDKGNFFALNQLFELFNRLHENSSFGVRHGRPGNTSPPRGARDWPNHGLAAIGNRQTGPLPLDYIRPSRQSKQPSRKL